MNPLATIGDAVDALTNPIIHSERIYERDRIHRNKRLRYLWTTTHPSLLQQLANAVYPGEVYVEDEPHTRHVFGPQPPARLEAVNALLQIEAGACVWMVRAGLPQRATATKNLRAMVGAHLDSDDATGLLRDLRHWYGWAATLTGWERPPWTPQAPCPACDTRKLRVRAERQTATCIACGEAWTPDTIGILAQHLATFEHNPSRDTSELRTLAVLARREGERRWPRTRPDLPYAG